MLALGHALAGALEVLVQHLTPTNSPNDPRTLEKPDPTGRTSTPTPQVSPNGRSTGTEARHHRSTRWIQAKGGTGSRSDRMISWLKFG